MNPSNQHPIPDSTSRRQFLAASLGILSLPTLLESAAAASEKKVVPVPETIGPVLGHIDEQRIFCFVRPHTSGKVTLSVKDQSNKEVARLTVEALPENDLCAHFAVTGLKPGTRYRGEFFNEAETTLFEGCRFDTVTATLPAVTSRTTLALGSCVSSTEFDELWIQIGKQNPDAFCLLGDTPYIDSNDLEKNRRARKILWGHLPSLAALTKRIPFWNTWDDHDFGRNDSDGRMPLKENIRKAFTEYNALANYGENDGGIYTSFRRGSLEVWFIDDRWFSQTEPSWADPKQATCIGKRQWDWLRRTLKASDAPFKILCTGMTWYPKGGKEKDHWETYSSEREAIYSFIMDEKIPGVVLISGDIHVSRHHDYGESRIGYPLHECVVSPMHASVIPNLDIAHPARIWSKPEPNVFMIMEADKETLHATWINMAGEKLHDFKLTAAELRA
jgi:alkaline phosphatase D